MKFNFLIIALVLFAACKKNLTNDQLINSSQQAILGKWKLVQYWKENTNGTGEWLPTDSANMQIVRFMADGSFTYNENFVIQKGINRYKFLEPHKILLYSSSNSTDSSKYFYRQDYNDELIFNPLCIEFSCMRRWVRMPGN